MATYKVEELLQVFDNAEMYKDTEFPLTCGLLRYMDDFQYRRATEEQKANYIFTEPKENLKKLVSGGFVKRILPDTQVQEVFLKVLNMPQFKDYNFGTREEIHVRIKHIDTEYTFLQVSDIKPTKLSGVRKKFIGREAAKYIEKTLEKQKQNCVVEYNDRFSEWFRILENDTSLLIPYVTGKIRIAKLIKNETILKPVKILQAMYPDMDKDKLSIVSGYIADALKEREQNIRSTYTLKEWEVPSDIYHSRHDYHLTSCMKDMDELKPCSDHEYQTNTFQLYDDLPNTTILVCRDKGVVAGRALLHRDVLDMDSGERLNIMDRIYASNSDIIAAFKIWAKKNNFARKLEQRLGEENYVLPNDTVKYLPHLRLDTHGIYQHDYERVPYVDTFSFYYTEEPDYLYSWLIKDSKGERDRSKGDMYILESTTGYDEACFFTESAGKKCCHCDGIIRDSENYEEVDGDYYCEDCFNDHFAYCEQCGDLICTDTEDHVYIENRGYVCSYCADRYYTKCEICGEYHLPKEMEEYYDERGNESWVCPECRSNNYRCTQCGCCNTYIHPDYTHTCFTKKGEQVWCDHCIREKATWCRECEEWFPKAEGYQTDSGVWYCAKCSEEED